ncbi:hypothetical protein ACFSUD_03425 [Sulfitobacter aestuarii]|uniref:YARHG domain-containing protein n=1 Tax=Sulfitobacter aestuarii TaxID=2161676 RepID=A0ABW5TY96_9RHOB
MFRLLMMLMLLTPGPALAEETAQSERCRAMVNGSEVVVEEDRFATFADEVKRREKLRNWPSRRWNKTWGIPPACDSGVLYDYLATTIPTEEIDGYCLTSNAEQGYFLVPGNRNYRGMCKKTICERVNTTAEETAEITRDLTRSTLQSATNPENLRAVAHKSGALILSGTASSLSTSLSAAGATLMTALSTPAALAAVGVSVVAVGGAVYMCSDG